MTTTYKSKQPGGADRRYRNEARIQDKKAQKSDIDPRLRMLRAQITALNTRLNDIIKNIATNIGPAAPTWWMNNDSGGTLSAGDVVVVDNVTTRSVTTTTDPNDPRPAAVVLTTGPTADGSDIEIRFTGMANATVDADVGAIAMGDALSLHATPKQLRKTLPLNPNSVAIASEALAAGQEKIAVFMAPSFRQALNDLAIEMGARIRKEFHFDANDMLCSAHWYWSASSIITARHYAYNYSGDYLVSFTYSQLSTDATHKHDVTKALEYAGDLLDKLIAEVT